MFNRVSVPEMTVQELKKLMDDGKAPFVLDIRESHEYDIANLSAPLIPMGELPQRLDEIAAHKAAPMVVHCRSGGRSAQVVKYLRQQGYDAINLKGGILAWSRFIDPSVPTY